MAWGSTGLYVPFGQPGPGLTVLRGCWCQADGAAESLFFFGAEAGPHEDRVLKDHIHSRIRHSMISWIPLVLGLGTSMCCLCRLVGP